MKAFKNLLKRLADSDANIWGYVMLNPKSFKK